jgi:hypothetical protein
MVGSMIDRLVRYGMDKRSGAAPKPESQVPSLGVFIQKRAIHQIFKQR